MISRHPVLSKPKRSGGYIEGCVFAMKRCLSCTLRYAAIIVLDEGSLVNHPAAGRGAILFGC